MIHNGEWKLGDLSVCTDGEILSQFEREAVGIEVDTRKEVKGKVFIALVGKNFNAHEFLQAAVEQGAAILIIEGEPDQLESLKEKVSIIRVESTTKALQQIANKWRKRLGTRVVAITGSNGKTTTKEFTKTVLETKYKVFATQGNLNNHWGVPFTLLSMTEEHQVAIIEMGMNHIGEITVLAETAEPNIVLVTTVGASHVGEVGSVAKVAQGKAELYKACPKAISIFNLDNSYTSKMYDEFKAEVFNGKSFCFSSYKTEDVEVNMKVTHLTTRNIEVEGRIGRNHSNAIVKVFGRQNIYALMGAATIALAVGMRSEDIWKGLAKCKTFWGRNQNVLLRNGAHVIFDAYNSNPQSVEALLKNLFETSCNGKKHVVLGEMKELGDFAPKYHEEMGLLAGRCAFDTIYYIGQYGEEFRKGVEASGEHENLVISDTYNEKLAIDLYSVLEKSDIVAVKGSRGMHLERFMDHWDPINFDK